MVSPSWAWQLSARVFDVTVACGAVELDFFHLVVVGLFHYDSTRTAFLGCRFLRRRLL